MVNDEVLFENYLTNYSEYPIYIEDLNLNLSSVAKRSLYMLGKVYQNGRNQSGQLYIRCDFFLIF